MDSTADRASWIDKIIDVELHPAGDVSPSRLARLKKTIDRRDVAESRHHLRARADLREVKTTHGIKFVPADQGGAA